MSLFQSLAVTAALQGKRCAFGVHTTASADDEVATGIPIVEGGLVSLAAAPVATHETSMATPGATAGTLDLRGYKTLGGTPAAATTPWVAVAWFAWGRDK